MTFNRVEFETVKKIMFGVVAAIGLAIITGIVNYIINRL